MIDQVVQIRNRKLSLSLFQVAESYASYQIPLAEVDNVRDMNNELIASDVQKAILWLFFKGFHCAIIFDRSYRISLML